MARVASNKAILKLLSPDLHNDKAIIGTAINYSGYALGYARLYLVLRYTSAPLQADKEVVLVA